MAKLVSMKIKKGDRDAPQPSTIATDWPLYPWGLCLTLDDDSLKKLGLDAGDLKVGSSMTLVANVEVSSISINDRMGSDGESQNVGLQITDLCLEDRGSKAADLADALYKKD